MSAEVSRGVRPGLLRMAALMTLLPMEAPLLLTPSGEAPCRHRDDQGAARGWHIDPWTCTRA